MKFGNIVTLAAVMFAAATAFASSANAAAKTYPPHGYPCLGCVPCPPSFCDDATKAMIKFNKAGEPVAKKYRELPKAGNATKQ